MSDKLTDEYTKSFVLACRNESESAKTDRMQLNRDNFAMYQLKHDFAHKAAGQSKEVLAKTRNATEQTKAFFQQSLADLDDWFRITARNQKDASLITPEEAQKLLNYMLKRSDYFSHVGNSVQSGILGSLSISRIGGQLVSKPKFKSRVEGKGKNYRKHVVMTKDKSWELRFWDIRQENFNIDPHGAGLYKIEDCFMDLHAVKQLAEGDDAIYDKSVVDGLRGFGSQDEKEASKNLETGQNTPLGGMRPRVKVTQFWGTIVDQETGDILAENIVCDIANDDVVLRKPTENPLWHQRDPIVAAALIEVTNSVWGIALMDAGTKHNRSLVELFNLMLDSAMKAVWGVSQIRTDVLKDLTQIQGGVKWGTVLEVDSSLGQGQSAMEEIITGKIPAEVMSMYQILAGETTTSMFTNDLRTGNLGGRDIKATAVVAAENSITGVFQGLAKNFEQKKIQPELELAWMTVAQNWDLIDPEVFKSLFGNERGAQLSQMEPQEVFVQTVNGFRFEVFGISLALRRQADFRKWTTLLQTIGSSEVLIEAFMQRFSFEKYLGEVMTSIDIDKSKIANDEPAPAEPPAQGAPPEQAAAQPGGAPGAAPNQMSQVPSAASVPGGALAAAMGGQAMSMPASQAIR